ncbi:serine--tRNA ligase [Candidatus Pacearchaeota archaeon CG10_big_fil_rev_8_21_14_0_10_35_13]|nr:MAG: serine--tRNA ligase [Candidatus Pacearchaeota archaeon CG10_big_fil_rev_8_21_14_0_10_35_13]
MLDLKFIRDSPEVVKKNLKIRGYSEAVSIVEILKLDTDWRKLKSEDDSLRSEKNKLSKAISDSKKSGDKRGMNELLSKAKMIPEKLDSNEAKEKEIKERLDSLLSLIPSIISDDVPIGGEDKNKEVYVKNKSMIPKLKNPKTHLELGEALDIIDIKRSTKLSGAGFYILKGKGARLQRALVQFMLDFHEKNGLVEINPPQLVNKESLFGTGQLPKFDDQQFKTIQGNYLIPTSEVPVTNMYSGETLNHKVLPLKFCAFTQCYRTEAGRHTGEEGLFRLHQFEKVEMVYFCKSDDSWKFLEEMTLNAEKILGLLELPYRRLLLSSEDASFSSAKTYDLEVWSPAMKRWLETSSCSNCTDFQARRMNLRYQDDKGQLNFCHTLNGSGLALPRLMISLIECNQQSDGSIKIPKALWKYTGFKVIK